MNIFDLTLPIESGMAGIPGIAFYDRHPVSVQAVTVIDEAQRALLEAEGVAAAPGAPATNSMNTVLTINSHVGTHIDAPRHFLPQGGPVDSLPLDRLVMREAVIIDVSHKAPGEGVTAADLDASGVAVAPGQVPVIMTRWTDRAWGTPEFWSNTIYLDPSVGPWVVSRGAAAVAMDCFPEKPFWRMSLEPHERGANHRLWLGKGIPMIQMLCGVDRLKGRPFRITALPLRLKGMDGSPARVVGIQE
jgi:kynurenine formamidase